ncbi:MAG: hypothetical protein NTY01_13955 [Verrucomicrobia bacterium]|nr:hypothetical protein [Verrucomicrobiota bacterium]
MHSKNHCPAPQEQKQPRVSSTTPPPRNEKLIVEATMSVTNEVVLVWSGVKTGGNDPAGLYTRVDGLDPLALLTVEAV